MSGHSKWSTIKHAKGILDAKRGKIFTKHARNITIAARAGGDPSMNPALRLVVDRAKADNMPKDNIERAIRRGTGEDKDAAQYTEVSYEVIGPAGSIGIVQAQTDNRNRTAADIRHLADSNGGKIAAQGAVSFQFERTGYISLHAEGQPLTVEELELLAIDLGALDVQFAAGVVEIYTPPAELMHVREKLLEQGLTLADTKPFMKPATVVRIEDLATAKSVMEFWDAFEEHDDVSAVFTNIDLAENVIAGLG